MYEYEISEINLKIIDSYKIKSIKEMKKILKEIKELHYCLSFKRSTFSLINEWRAHNFLYNLHIKRSSTKDVDLNYNESSIRKIGYTILSLFYW